MLSLIALLTVATEPFAAFPDVTTVFYDVRGEDAATIRAAIETAEPRDPADGKPYEALTQVKIGWHWKGCAVKTATIRFSAVVTMPRLTSFNSLTPEMQAKWTMYIAALADHEAGHVKLAMQYLPKVRAAIAGASCRTANAAGRAMLRRLKAEDAAYDARTKHGATTGAALP